MPNWAKLFVLAAVLGPAMLCLPVLFSARAEILPVKTYTTADGLPHDETFKVRQDSRGLLWFCTNAGLVRFDGYTFKLYSTDDGLPGNVLFDVLETRNGAYWLATDKGLVRFDPHGVRGASSAGRARPMFTTYKPAELPLTAPNRDRVNALAEGLNGRVWLGTAHGLYFFEENEKQAQWRKFELPVPNQKTRLWIKSLLADGNGGLWIAAEQQVLTGYLYHLDAAGKIELYELSSHSPNALLKERNGTIWVGFSTGADWQETGLCRFKPPLRNSSNGFSILFPECYRKRNGPSNSWITALCQTADGKIWAGTEKGLAVFDPARHVWQTFNEQAGIFQSEITDLCEDRDGNLWVTSTSGVMKIVRNGFVRFSQADGLADLQVTSLFNARDGKLTVATSANRDLALNFFDGQRFTPVKVNTPPGTNHGWGWGQIVVNARNGDWWIPTEENILYRFPRQADVRQLARIQPRAYSTREAFTDKMAARLYEDQQGDLWISTYYQNKLLRWDSTTDTISNLSEAAGVPQMAWPPDCYAEDRAGNLWFGSYSTTDGRLLRYREGRFKSFTEQDGLPRDDKIASLMVDHQGRLWLGTKASGVGRIDDPTVEPLRIAWYNRANGLSINDAECLVEDRWGRIYIGTGHGVDCLTPATKQVRAFTSADGLPKGKIQVSAKDAQETLWFGSVYGVARFVPEPPRANPPPTIFLAGVRVAGIAQPVSEIGDLNPPELKLNSSQTNVTIDFLSPSATADPHLRYQYKLEGREDWSAPTEQRSVDFANLSAGSYRFLVRAVNADGIHSDPPANVSFTVAAPIWLRWWFILLTSCALGGLAYAAYRYRVAQLLALERMRTRIATDLHDEVGSSLSQIAILSEVARMRLPRNSQSDAAIEPMEKVAVTSREAVDAMSDIVWAINPQRDQLSDLTQRMRRFAGETLTALDIRLRFHAPEQDLSLDAEMRRQVFLLFKEAINNIARHAQATEVEINFALTDHQLTLRVWDNGHGFAESAPQPGRNGGNGLLSMRRRAAELGGRLEVSSGNGSGTTIRLEAPLGGRKFL